MSADTGRLDWVPVDRISDRASRITPGRAILQVLGAVLFAVGWLVAKFFRVLWAMFAWTVAAIMTGWDDAHGKRTGTVDVQAVMAENARLRAELSRVS